MLNIDCDQLFDGHELLGPSRLVIEGGLVSTVLSTARGSLPEDDGAFRTAFAMPGLIDSHVHVTGYGEGNPAGAPFEPHKHFLRLCAYTGVTTLRDVGNTIEAIDYLREWSAKYDGPRIFSSGPILDRPPLTWPFSRMVRTQPETASAVARLNADGVDWIKAYRRVDTETMGWIVAAARDAGLPVAADCGLTSAVEAATAGVRSLEHVVTLLSSLRPRTENGTAATSPASVPAAWDGLDLDSAATDQLCDVMVREGTFLCPTVLVSRRIALSDEMARDPYLDFGALVMPYNRRLKRMDNPIGARIGKRYMAEMFPSAATDKATTEATRRGVDCMGALITRLHGAGVKVVMGSDAPNPSLTPGYSLQQELAEAERHGLSPLDLLRSCTSTAGELLGQETLGVLGPGSAADVLCIAGDPARRGVAEITKLERVMVRGQWVDRDRLAEKLKKAVEAS